jgi:phosphomannomutase
MTDVPKKLEAIEGRYKDGQIARLDGLSIDYADWRFNVRPSNTEPLLRLNLEAATPQEMEKRRDEVLNVIRG